MDLMWWPRQGKPSSSSLSQQLQKQQQQSLSRRMRDVKQNTKLELFIMMIVEE